jgi:2-polyprenyl-6-hydroxyphenyl methylase/3-demethylubiquinone-9 3-methyltransferase
MEPKTSTVNPQEVEQFSRIASEWWNPHGKFKPLHDINPLRIEWVLKRVHSGSWIVDSEKEHHQPPTTSHQPLQGKTLLDIGCGGGLMCEPMARLGAEVTGIDASEKNISVAKLHAGQSGLAIDYRCTTAEQLRDSGLGIGDSGLSSPESRKPKAESRFDIVLALEIIEHVDNVPLFVESCAALVKPGGLLFISTINRTPQAYLKAIIGAEYVLRLLPRGTHDWKKFLKPHEIHRELEKNGMEVAEMAGMVLNPLSWQWRWNPHDLSVNYILMARKPA